MPKKQLKDFKSDKIPSSFSKIDKFGKKKVEESPKKE